MDLLLKLGLFGRRPAELGPELSAENAFPNETAFIRTFAWIAAGAGALALGLFAGRELRSRYKFNRRTPYDFYAHSDDSQEFGVGI